MIILLSQKTFSPQIPKHFMIQHFHWRGITDQLQQLQSPPSWDAAGFLSGEPEEGNPRRQAELLAAGQLPHCCSHCCSQEQRCSNRPTRAALDPKQAQFLQQDLLLFSFFFRQPWNYILPWGIKLPGPLALHQLAYSIAPRASILNVVPLSTASCMGLNVWRKIVKRVLCSSWLPRGLDLGWLSFVSSILMTCFRQTFGNAFLAGKTYFLEEISFHIAKWIGKRGPLYGKGGKLCTGYKTQSKLDLLDYRKKAGQKWSKERQGTILKKYPGFPQWENVHAMEPTELPMPSGYLQQFWSRVSLNHRVTAVLPHSSPTCKTWISTQVRSSLY